MPSPHSRPQSVRQRPRRQQALASLIAAMSLVLCLSPATQASAVTSSTFASQSGRQILSAAMSAALNLASCTSTSATKISGQAYSSITNSAMTTGQQTLVVGAAWTVVRVVGGVAYIKENSTAMREQFSVNDPKADNRWISIPHSNSNFARFSTYILLPSMLSEMAPSGTLKTTKTTTVNHRRVVGVTGKPNIHLGLASGTETVYVSVSLPHVPVELVASDVVQGQRQTFVITYTNWGRDFRIAKPSPVIAITSTKLPS